jgi:hypothetical protein
MGVSQPGAFGVNVVAGRGRHQLDVSQGRSDKSAAGDRESFARLTPDGQDGEAPGGLAAERLHMQGGDGLDDSPARAIEVSELDEVIGQRSALVASPGGECREQRPLANQAVLQGKQTEEEIAIGIDRGHGTGLLRARCPQAPGLRRRRPPHVP